MTALAPTSKSLLPGPASGGLLVAAHAVRCAHEILAERETTRRLRQEHRHAIEAAEVRLQAMRDQLAYNLRFAQRQIEDAERARQARLRVIEGLREELHRTLDAFLRLAASPDLPDGTADRLQQTIGELLQALVGLAEDLGTTSIAEVG